MQCAQHGAIVSRLRRIESGVGLTPGPGQLGSWKTNQLLDLGAAPPRVLFRGFENVFEQERVGQEQLPQLDAIILR